MQFRLIMLLGLLGLSYGSPGAEVDHHARDLGSIPVAGCLCQHIETTELVLACFPTETALSLASAATADRSSTSRAPTVTTAGAIVTATASASANANANASEVDYMRPCDNPTIDKSAPANFVPSVNLAAYYQSSDSSAVAIVTFTNLQYPTVVLEYIASIQAYSSIGSNLVITFKDVASVQAAASSWQASVAGGLVLLAYCPTCGPDYPYQRAWLYVQSLAVDVASLTITCGYNLLEITEVATVVDIKIGPSDDGQGQPSNSASSSALFSSFLSTKSTAVASRSTTVPKSSFTTTPATTSGLSLPTGTAAPSQSLLDFDVALDDSLGYLDPSSAGFWAQLMPGVDSSSFGSRKLRTRAFSFPNIVSSLVNAAKNAITSNPAAAVDAAVNFLESVETNGFVNTVISTTASIVQDLLNYISSFTLGPFPFSFMPGTQTSTPFGDGVQLLDKSGTAGIASGEISAYCVGCGVSGSVTIAGQFVVDVQQEALQTATLDISGPLHAQLAFALVGKVAASNSFQTQVFKYAIPPGLTILKLITIGPFVSVDVGGSFDFSLQGGVELGGSLDWSNIDASIDLLAQTFSPSGYYPQFSPIFDFSESASLGATLYGLVTLGAGIDILGGKYKADVGVVGKPEIDLQANQQLYSKYELSQLADGTVVCGGVSLTAQQIDSAYLEIGFVNGNNGTKSKTLGLATVTPYTFSTCFGQESTITQSSSSMTTTQQSSATTSSPPQSSCYYLDTDEPDNDGDEDMTCVPLTTSGTVSTSDSSSSSSSTSTSSASLTTASCDPSLDDFAFVSCISSQLASQQSAEASIFGGVVPPPPAAKRDLLPAPMLTTAGSVPSMLPSRATRRDAKHGHLHVARQTGSSPSSPSSAAAANPTAAGIAAIGGQAFVSWTDDGNLVVDNDGSRAAFQAVDGVVFGDPYTRFLHLYQDTMASLGVSRLRLASLDEMPTPSVLVVLYPLTLRDGSQAYIATTTDGQLFYLATCLIAEQYPKLFLVRDVTAGIAQLESPALADTLVGGNVTQCGFVGYKPS